MGMGIGRLLIMGVIAVFVIALIVASFIAVFSMFKKK